MKSIILILIITTILQSCSTGKFNYKTQNSQWAKHLQLDNKYKHDLSASNYIIDEDNVLVMENRTNSFPTDKNSPFYKINQRTGKSKKLNPGPRTITEIRKYDFYSKNRAD